MRVSSSLAASGYTAKAILAAAPFLVHAYILPFVSPASDLLTSVHLKPFGGVSTEKAPLTENTSSLAPLLGSSPPAGRASAVQTTTARPIIVRIVTPLTMDNNY